MTHPNDVTPVADTGAAKKPRRIPKSIWALAVIGTLLGSCRLHGMYGERLREKPVIETSPWTEFVPVKGQPLPVPKQWLSDDEARLAHDLVLPQKLGDLMVPFDFEKARKNAWWPKGKSVGDQYLEHLCDYEAGEWIFRVTEPQVGFYWARRSGLRSMADYFKVYAQEAPVLEWHFSIDELNEKMSLRDPLGIYKGYAGDDEDRSLYRFIEERVRGFWWQKDYKKPYLRAYGHQRDQYQKAEVPMKILELDEPTAKYAVTFRGLRRDRDREHRIAGYELITYDRKTLEVLAVKRQFLRMWGPGEPTYGGGHRCRRINDSDVGWSENALRLVLLSIPSSMPNPITPDRFTQPTPTKIFKGEQP